jgi:NADH-quinone oxidoreductase subunit H
MIAADLNIGLLYVLAISSISTYAIFMGGWASRNKFSMLGAMRSVAQIVSYEVPAAVSLVCVIMISQTMSLGEIVAAQSKLWFVFTPWGFLGCAIFFLSSVAEVNRTPFDMPEAESELVAGFHTEYSGMKFALWYMAEFLEAFAISAFTVTFFLGGWHGPAIPFWIFLFLSCIPVLFANVLHPILKGILVSALVLAAFVFWKDSAPSWFWFFFKTYLLIAVLVWLRGTFPRLRVDQLMGFAWKFLLPLALMNILAAGVWTVFPGFKGMVSSLILIIISFWFLVRINSPSPLKPRTYVLAD